MVLVPLVKVTVPVGVGPVFPATTAIRIVCGFAPVVVDVPRSVVVGISPMVRVEAAETLGELSESPP
jgi:hypothetical protein